MNEYVCGGHGKALRFKTNPSRGKGALPILLLEIAFACLIIVVLVTGYKLSTSESTVWRYVALAGVIWGLQTLFVMLARLWVEAQTVFLRGDRIRVYPLFGRSRAIRIREITDIYKSRDWGILSLEFRNRKGQKVRIFAEIDYFGFIWDYILERVNPDCKVDWAFVEQCRNLSGVWIYTRRYPYKTEYPLGYLWLLRQVVTEQRDRLIAEGKLHGGKAFYGDPHLLRIGERDK